MLTKQELVDWIWTQFLRGVYIIPLQFVHQLPSLGTILPTRGRADLFWWWIGPITSWEIDGETVETVETVADLILGGSKITADGDCSHEIKRHLLLGRKVMTNLDSILKSRGITLPTKARLVKAMVFPVVMYVCESWTVKKTECWRIDGFELWCQRRLLRVPWTTRRSN